MPPLTSRIRLNLQQKKKINEESKKKNIQFELSPPVSKCNQMNVIKEA